jgi:ribosomal protein S18 acetylase RimI-like enzyme
VDIAITSLGYRTDLMLLEMSGSVLTDKGEYVVVRTPANPTFWWGNYLLFRTPFAPGDAVKREEIFRSEFPEAAHRSLGLDTTDGLAGSDEELKAAGFEIERNTVMTATEVRAPARPNETSQYRFLSGDGDWEQLNELTLRLATMEVDDDYREYTRRRTAAERALCDAGHAKWFGAFEGDRLQASLGLASDGSGVARFQTVQTHPDDQGRGLASTLVHRASRYGFDELGAHTLVMVADPDYRAIRIYRSLGFNDSEVQLQVSKRPGSA